PEPSSLTAITASVRLLTFRVFTIAVTWLLVVDSLSESTITRNAVGISTPNSSGEVGRAAAALGRRRPGGPQLLEMRAQVIEQVSPLLRAAAARGPELGGGNDVRRAAADAAIDVAPGLLDAVDRDAEAVGDVRVGLVEQRALQHAPLGRGEMDARRRRGEQQRQRADGARRDPFAPQHEQLS